MNPILHSALTDSFCWLAFYDQVQQAGVVRRDNAGIYSPRLSSFFSEFDDYDEVAEYIQPLDAPSNVTWHHLYNVTPEYSCCA